MSIETGLAVVISAIVSASIAGAFAVVTSNKTRQHRHQEDLSAQRMQSHPQLYRIFSSLLKKIELGIHTPDTHDFSLTKLDVIAYFESLNEWDSSGACWVSDPTAHMLFIYRHWLSKHLKMPPNEFLNSFVKGSILREELIFRTRLLESRIRDELGVKGYSVIPISAELREALEDERDQYCQLENFGHRTISPRQRHLPRRLQIMKSFFSKLGGIL
jgi:hypothetical protein